MLDGEQRGLAYAFFQFVLEECEFNYVISANIHRRHLNPEQKRDLIAKVLTARPELSNRTVAEQTKTSHKKVGKVRAKLESTGALPQLEKTVGKDGKARKQPSRADRAEARCAAQWKAFTAQEKRNATIAAIADGQCGDACLMEALSQEAHGRADTDATLKVAQDALNAIRSIGEVECETLASRLEVLSVTDLMHVLAAIHDAEEALRELRTKAAQQIQGMTGMTSQKTPQ